MATKLPLHFITSLEGIGYTIVSTPYSLLDTRVAIF